MLYQRYISLARQLALLMFIAYPAYGFGASVGQVDFSVGQVVAMSADGAKRPLQKGSEVNSGDSIITAEGARVQVHFSDGGFVSLQPNSLFRIDQYQYEGKTDGKEKGFFSLLKGGLRAITGAIGHVNRQTYKVATPAATIGVRGTGYNAMLNDGLFVSVSEGAISLNNNAGILVVNAGESAFVANFDTKPVYTTQNPQLPQGIVPPVSEPNYSVGEQRDSSGNLIVVPPPSNRFQSIGQ